MMRGDDEQAADPTRLPSGGGAGVVPSQEQQAKPDP